MALPTSTSNASLNSSASTPSGEPLPAPNAGLLMKPRSSTSSASSPASPVVLPSITTTTSTVQPTSPSLLSARPSISRKAVDIAAEAKTKLLRPIKPVLRKGAKILFVGEVPGEQEVIFGMPFVGHSGQLLREMLLAANIVLAECSTTCVFLSRPPNNTLNSWGTMTLAEARAHVDPSKPFALIHADNKTYVPTNLVQDALVRLREEIVASEVNVVVALGNTALAALCGITGVGKVRGTVYNSTLVPGVKVLPTYNPAAVFSQYDLRPICEADFLKLSVEARNKEFNFIRRLLYINPTVEDVIQWGDLLAQAASLAVDVETKNKQVTCIGFAPDKFSAYVIPFWTSNPLRGHSYWSTFADEKIAYLAVQKILSSPALKIMQNGLYDIQYCLRHLWRVQNFAADTMLKHHALYPNLPKGLDFLGSIYCNERSWKKMRPRGGEEKKEA